MCIRDRRKELDSAIALPLVVVHFSDQMAESLKGQQKEGSPAFDGAPGVSGDFDLPQLYAAYRAGAISKTQVEEAMAQAQKAFGSIDESLIRQQAIMATKEMCIRDSTNAFRNVARHSGRGI